MSDMKILGKREIGAAIRQRRRELALSQEGLAVRLNVSYQQVQRYESGRTGITVENLQLLAQALAVSVDYFFTAGVEVRVGRDRDDVEGELLSQYRKIRHQGAKEMVVNFTRLMAGWEGEESLCAEGRVEFHDQDARLSASLEQSAVSGCTAISLLMPEKARHQLNPG